MMVISGNILLGTGIAFIAGGVISIYFLPDFYARIVIASKVDVVGFLTCLFGAMLISGFSALTFKLLVIVLFEIITAPLATHSIAHSAFSSGYRVRPEKLADGESVDLEKSHGS